MDEKGIKELLKKYRGGLCTPDEIAFLESWYAQWNNELPIGLTDQELAADLLIIGQRVKPLHSPAVRFLWVKIAAAAVILLFISFGIYKFMQPAPASYTAQNKIVPGDNKAVLTMASGKKFYLNNVKLGQLTRIAGINIVKSKSGQISYIVSSKRAATVQYNTITTPKGGQWDVILADGTHVWLNAASSLRFPTVFNLKNRCVQLIGEGYFEVAKDSRHPFIVETDKENIQVLGTHFNVNSYSDETDLKTTLLEGSVKITSTGSYKTVVIKPGQQAVLTNNSLNIKPADIEEAMAWRSGLFIYNDESLASIMRKVARWYDVDISYQHIDPHKTFWGSESRYGNIEQLLHKLELTGGVHFKIEGRRIIATP